MSQFFTVSECFPNSENGQRVIRQGQYGPTVKWLFKVNEQATSKWMSVNRKPDNDLKPGDQVYGEIGQWPDGGEKFIRMQAPQQGGYAQPQAPQQPQYQPRPQPQNTTSSAPQSSVTLDMVYQELKYVRGLLENGANFQADDVPTENPSNEGPQNDDDGLDLSQFPE